MGEREPEQQLSVAESIAEQLRKHAAEGQLVPPDDLAKVADLIEATSQERDHLELMVVAAHRFVREGEQLTQQGHDTLARDLEACLNELNDPNKPLRCSPKKLVISGAAAQDLLAKATGGKCLKCNGTGGKRHNPQRFVVCAACGGSGKAR